MTIYHTYGCYFCGPQEEPYIHSYCHRCSHLLDNHSDTLDCRICKQKCGIRTRWTPGQISDEDWQRMAQIRHGWHGGG